MKRQNKIILVVLLFIVLAFVLSGCVSPVNNQPYSVSGYVRDIQGNPISGVTISFSNGYSSVITNSQGYWSASGLTGNVIVTPLYSGYSFSPSSITVSSASSN
ncbi:MAG: carboxypeptidase-like regulatory domain-containing protein, partial [Athalassotoga sp.]|uniref:carboxypeptidase-like regulatory domain-containing protein n=1 Tax=Athalassotoga sp. TaxID=2022597 RepID=UPI003D08BFC3